MDLLMQAEMNRIKSFQFENRSQSTMRISHIIVPCFNQLQKEYIRGRLIKVKSRKIISDDQFEVEVTLHIIN